MTSILLFARVQYQNVTMLLLGTRKQKGVVRSARLNVAYVPHVHAFTSFSSSVRGGSTTYYALHEHHFRVLIVPVVKGWKPPNVPRRKLFLYGSVNTVRNSTYTCIRAKFIS